MGAKLVVRWVGFWIPDPNPWSSDCHKSPLLLHCLRLKGDTISQLVRSPTLLLLLVLFNWEGGEQEGGKGVGGVVVGEEGEETENK